MSDGDEPANDAEDETADAGETEPAEVDEESAEAGEE